MSEKRRDQKGSDSSRERTGEDFEFETDYEFEDWEAIPEEEASRILKGLEALIPSVLKRSLSSVLSSEDGLRALLGDKNIPKEVLGFLLGQVDATRRGILRIVSREIRIFLENVDFGGELAKILTTLSFEVRTEIRFIPNDERLKPSIKNTVRVKRKPKDADEPEAEAEEAEDADALTEVEAVVEPAKKNRWTRRKRNDDA